MAKASKQLEAHGGAFSFGGLVAQCRERRGWTQKELADRLGVTGAYVSQLEGGKEVSPERARKVAAMLGIAESDYLPLLGRPAAQEEASREAYLETVRGVHKALETNLRTIRAMLQHVGPADYLVLLRIAWLESANSVLWMALGEKRESKRSRARAEDVARSVRRALTQTTPRMAEQASSFVDDLLRIEALWVGEEAVTPATA
jgi:transcriptional regulator with XRE-family HTH domain